MATSLSDEQKQKRIAAARRGGLARAQQFTSASQRHARRHVTRESLIRAGAKGAQVTAERHGYEVLFERSRYYRLHNPSPLELQTIGILARLKVAYEREYRLGLTLYTVDFYLPKQKLAIEVDGKINEPRAPEYGKRQERKRRKAALLASMGSRLLTLDWREYAELQDVIAKIRAEVGDV